MGAEIIKVESLPIWTRNGERVVTKIAHAENPFMPVIYVDEGLVQIDSTTAGSPAEFIAWLRAVADAVEVVSK